MNPITFSRKICTLPVINLYTGGVISHGCDPLFSPDTLTFRALSAGNDTANSFLVPASAISFVNDVCVMVQISAETEPVSGDGLCRLIGEPLEARAGALALFRFGEIVAADVAGDGSVTSVTMSDGQVLEIPRDGAEALTVPPGAPEKTASEDNAFAPGPSYAPAVTPEPEAPAVRTEPSFSPEPEFTEEQKNDAAEAAPEDGEKKDRRIDWKDLKRRYVPPLAAMGIYFVLYFVLAMNVFKIVH